MNINNLNLIIAVINLGINIITKNWSATFGWAAATILALQIIVLSGGK